MVELFESHEHLFALGNADRLLATEQCFFTALFSFAHVFVMKPKPGL